MHALLQEVNEFLSALRTFTVAPI